MSAYGGGVTQSNWEGGHGYPRPGPPPSASRSSEQAEAVPVGRAGPLNSLPSWARAPAGGRVGLARTCCCRCLWTQVSLPRLRLPSLERPRARSALSSPAALSAWPAAPVEGTALRFQDGA